MLAARGTRDLDDGEVPVEDASERDALRRRARGIWWRTALVAAAGTALVVALPL